MSDNQPTIWPCEKHTLAKHAILRRYLEAWFPILGKTWPKVVYIDGFAGPGIYQGNEPGSPLIALDVAQKCFQNSTTKPQLIFVESVAARFHSLKSIIDSRTYPSNFEVTLEHGEFGSVLSEQLNTLEATKTSNDPIFVFIDPFGYAGVPFNQLQRLLRWPRTEILMLFARRDINRFLDHKGVKKALQEVFGLPIEDIKIPAGKDRAHQIREFYKKRLQTLGKFILDFSMYDSNNQPIYDLFFVSNHALGFVKMKESMWKIDELGGIRFSDKDDANQMMAFNEDPISQIADIILKWGNDKQEVQIESLTKHIENSTRYLRKHMVRALKMLESDNRIVIPELKQDGKPRRKNTYPDEAFIRFALKNTSL